MPCSGNENIFLIADDVMFMDDTTLYEVLDVSSHVSGTQIGGLFGKVNRARKFTVDVKMELSFKKCKEMVIDFRKNKSIIISPLEINGHKF